MNINKWLPNIATLALVVLLLVAQRAWADPAAAQLAPTATTASSETAVDDSGPSADTTGIGFPSITSAIVPTGAILMWSGSIADIPDGWQLCDGTNGTPNLLDKFILSVGVGEEPRGEGGQHIKPIPPNALPSHTHSVTIASDGVHGHPLTINEGGTHDHPLSIGTGGSHNHTVSISSNGDHRHELPLQNDDDFMGGGGKGGVDDTDGSGDFDSRSDGGHSHSGSISTGGSHTHPGTASSNGLHTHAGAVGNSTSHTHTGSIGSTGEGASFDVRPQYFELAFIMKL